MFDVVIVVISVVLIVVIVVTCCCCVDCVHGKLLEVISEDYGPAALVLMLWWLLLCDHGNGLWDVVGALVDIRLD